MANLITGLFDTETAAENAVTQLKTLGYGQNEISVVMKDRGEAKEFAEHTGSHAMEGIGTGAAIGGTVGALLGGLLAVGSVTIPGVGLVAAGAIASMLAGAGAGGLAGSLLGWLVGAGIPEDVAPYYERGLSEGGVVVAVAAHSGDETRVQQVLQNQSVAYSGHSEGYVANQYASRHNDLATPTRTFDAPAYSAPEINAYNTAQTATEAQRTGNSMGAEQRSADRTADAHERAAERGMNDTNVFDRAATGVQNVADNTATAVHNQVDKVGTGMSNEADRLTRV